MSAKCQQTNTTSRWHRAGNFSKCVHRTPANGSHFYILINELTSSALCVRFTRNDSVCESKRSLSSIVALRRRRFLWIKWKFSVLRPAAGKLIEKSPECMHDSSESNLIKWNHERTNSSAFFLDFVAFGKETRMELLSFPELKEISEIRKKEMSIPFSVSASPWLLFTKWKIVSKL